MASEVDDLGDLDGVDPVELERQIALGRKVPPGKHHAALTNCEGPKAFDNGTQYRELTFCVLAGPAKGLEVKDKLFLSDDGKSRRLIFASRLGLLTKGPDGKYAKVPGKTEYTDVIGTQCVIDVFHKADKKDASVKFANLTFEGILRLDDERCKDVVFAGEAAAKAALAAKPKPTTNKDFDGL